MFVIVFGILLAVCGGVLPYTYHLGPCPVVEPMPGFQMKGLLGMWYVVQKTSTASHCITNNFTKMDEPGKYELIQTSQHCILGLTPLKHVCTGILSVPDPSLPARMKVRFSWSIAGSASYTIMSTDYTTYAAIFICQQLAFAHRRSEIILSRTQDLDRMCLDKLLVLNT